MEEPYVKGSLGSLALELVFTFKTREERFLPPEGGQGGPPITNGPRRNFQRRAIGRKFFLGEKTRPIKKTH